VKIALLGDIAPFGRFCMAHNPNLIAQFEAVRVFLSKHDAVIGNLETPFAYDESPAGWKSAHIKSHPNNIAFLTALGVTHVALANNHIGDFGMQAYERTKSLLDNNRIAWFGTEQRQARIENSGEKIALMGFCSYNTNPSCLVHRGGHVLNYLDVDTVIKEMSINAENGFLNILSVHSGQEHVHLPSSEDVAFARGLSEKFNYIYYGHHPHVLQGHERASDSIIFYSLGNFIFDDVYTPRDPQKPLIALSEANKTGVIATVEVKNGKVCGHDVAPVFLGKDQVLLGGNVPNFDMDTYNSELSDAGSEDYNRRRNLAITEYIESRRMLRNPAWYFRRLNMNSLGMILSARKNKRMHQAAFSSKLNRFEGLK
jgi:poly-gamma-glutamate synthesis protein (capsule biosynthesis protein)